MTSPPTAKFTPTVTATDTPTLTPTSTSTSTPALYLTPYYIGSGYFPTNNLKYCHTGPGYFDQVQGAANEWSADTDLNLSYDCTSRDIASIYADFGDAGFAGLAYICDINDQCGAPNPINSTYRSCGLWLNEYEISIHNPTFYTDAEVEKLAMHEFGHCFSLDHNDNDPTSVMGGASVPNAWDIYWINLRY